MASPASPTRSEQLSTTTTQAPVAATSSPFVVELQVGPNSYSLSWNGSGDTIKPLLTPKPKTRAEALSLTYAIAKRLGVLYQVFTQVQDGFQKEKDKLHEEIALLQKQLDQLSL